MVEGIHAFGHFQFVDHKVRQRRKDDLIAHLEQVLEQHHLQQHGVFHGAPEGDRDENDGVKRFADDRGADRTHPQLPAFGFDFELRKNH